MKKISIFVLLLLVILLGVLAMRDISEADRRRQRASQPDNDGDTISSRIVGDAEHSESDKLSVAKVDATTKSDEVDWQSLENETEGIAEIGTTSVVTGKFNELNRSSESDTSLLRAVSHVEERSDSEETAAANKREVPKEALEKELARQAILAVASSISGTPGKAAGPTDSTEKGYPIQLTETHAATEVSQENAETRGFQNSDAEKNSVSPLHPSGSPGKADVQTSELQSEDVKTEDPVTPVGNMCRRLGVRMRIGRDSITLGFVEPDGAAAKAGLKAGDTVIAINREPLLDTAAFADAISEVDAGGQVDVFVVRAEKWRAYTVSLSE